MNHVNIEKKIILSFFILFFFCSLFFIAAHYTLYAAYKQLIIYHQIRLRSLAQKKLYQEFENTKNVLSRYTYVNRASHYLIEHTNAYLKGRVIEGAEYNNNNNNRFSRKTSRRVSVRNRRSAVQASNVRQKINRRMRIGSTHSIFVWPLKRTEFWLSSFFGPRRKPDRSWGFHYGIDMAALKGTLVYAAAKGTVIFSGYQRGYGNTVLIAHSERYTTRYAHLDTLCTHKGAIVYPEKVIGTVGDTGYTITRGRDASHLHFEIADRGKQVNPLPLLPLL